MYHLKKKKNNLISNLNRLIDNCKDKLFIKQIFYLYYFFLFNIFIHSIISYM